MNDTNLSVELELALLAVLKNVRTASAKVAELQETPDFEPQTLALHSRALAVQVAALKTLTTIMAKLTPAEKPAESPAPPALRQEIPGPPRQEWSALRDECAALPHDRPGILKNFSSPPPPPGEGRVGVPSPTGSAKGG